MWEGCILFTQKKQYDLVDKIINILELDDENSIILYNLDNDLEKQNIITDTRNSILLLKTAKCFIKYFIRNILDQIK